MTTRITLLGTGTCQLQVARAAASILTEIDGQKVLFDCGRGVTDRLTQLGIKNDEIQHVVISHFHPDHISDLIPLMQAASWSRIDPRTAPLHLYGPPGLEEQMIRVMSLFEGSSLLRGTFEVHLHEHRSDVVEICGRKWEMVKLPHADNHGMRFEVDGMRVAYTGDCEFSPLEVEFLRGANFAVIDAGHLEFREIVALAVQSQAGTIVCSHLYQELNQGELNVEAHGAGYRGTIIVGHDLLAFDSVSRR